jgi:hypothetical protein
MKKAWLIGAAVVCGVLASGSRARADLIVWTERSFAKPVVLPATGPGKGAIVVVSDPFPSVHLHGTATIPVASLFAFSNDETKNPQTLKDVPITLTLKIHDLTQKMNGSVTFTGEVSGTLSAKQANITLTWSSTLERLHLGQYWYDVTMHPLDPGGPHKTGYLGTLHATVNVHHNPEPSSLILAVLGIPLVAVPGWRRWRRKKADTPILS